MAAQATDRGKEEAGPCLDPSAPSESGKTWRNRCDDVEIRWKNDAKRREIEVKCHSSPEIGANQSSVQGGMHPMHAALRYVGVLAEGALVRQKEARKHETAGEHR